VKSILLDILAIFCYHNVVALANQWLCCSVVMVLD